MLALCVGMAAAQAVSHDADKAATTTGHVIKHAGKKVGHGTKSSVKGAGHGTNVVAKDSAKGVKKTEGALRTPPVSKPASRLALDSDRMPRSLPGWFFFNQRAFLLDGAA